MDEHHGQEKVRSWNLKKEQKKNMPLLEKIPLFGVKWNWGL